MRKFILTIAGLLAFTTAPLVASTHVVDGTVMKIDQPAGKMTIRHGPIKKLDMEEPMTMVFRVQDPAIFKQVKVGQKIKFEADRVNGQITVMRIVK